MSVTNTMGGAHRVWRAPARGPWRATRMQREDRADRPAARRQPPEQREQHPAVGGLPSLVRQRARSGRATARRAAGQRRAVRDGDEPEQDAEQRDRQRRLGRMEEGGPGRREIGQGDHCRGYGSGSGSKTRSLRLGRVGALVSPAPARRARSKSGPLGPERGRHGAATGIRQAQQRVQSVSLSSTEAWVPLVRGTSQKASRYRRSAIRGHVHSMVPPSAVVISAARWPSTIAGSGATCPRSAPGRATKRACRTGRLPAPATNPTLAPRPGYEKVERDETVNENHTALHFGPSRSIVQMSPSWWFCS